ncbi:leucine zipper [Striga asiatica]|uniref:Leucine zipper n=1 Tax=Striga asiatica TaxID=4170 RepID=A0A5A7QE51_STRAF|nr:leucine zipper [Striga asiatica]
MQEKIRMHTPWLLRSEKLRTETEARGGDAAESIPTLDSTQKAFKSNPINKLLHLKPSTTHKAHKKLINNQEKGFFQTLSSACTLCFQSFDWGNLDKAHSGTSLNHNPSPVSLCLKSGDLGFFLPNLLSHHLFGFSTKLFQESSPFAPSTRFAVTNFTSDSSFVSPTPSPPSAFDWWNLDWGNLDKAHSGTSLNHNLSPVSLCLKSADLGLCFSNLLSHHLFGFSTKLLQESSPCVP